MRSIPRAASDVEHGSVEVQARRRRGHGARGAGEHRLVALAIGGVRRARDVGRQRRLPVRLEKRHEVAIHFDLGELARTRHGARARVSRQLDLPARLRLVTRAQVHEGAPCPEQPFEQDFDAPARRLAAHDAGRQHAGVVEHEQIACAQELRQLGECAIRKRAARAVEHEQPARAPLGERYLRDELGRQVEMKIAALHGGAILAARWRRARLFWHTVRPLRRDPRPWASQQR